MDLRATLLLASQTLTRNGIDHALIGGFAMAIYGTNRATADVDFLADGEKASLIRSSLEGVGFKAIHVTPEVAQFAGVGQLDVLMANRPVSRQMIKDAISDDRVPVRVLRAEDLIGLKIQAYCNDPARELRDKADIQSLLLARPDLDVSRIKTYADLFGQWAAIEALRTKT